MNQKGMIMVLGLLLLLVLTAIGMSAVGTTIFDIKISANYDLANQAFYTSDSGIEDAKTRLMSTGPSVITDNEIENPDWVVVIGTAEKAEQKGLSTATRLDKIEPSLDYFVIVKHKVNDSNQTLKWGDSNGDGVPEENTTYGNSIYVIISEEPQKVLVAEIVKFPPVKVLAAIYTKSNTTIQGSSTKILGNDACGMDSNPGIISMGTISLVGNPVVTGNPNNVVENSTHNIDINNIINSLKPYATHAYELSGNTTRTGENWGTPFIIANDQPSTYDGPNNIVYFNTNGSTLKLAGGTSGGGTLIVEGNLEVNGGFNWNGLILVTGSITFSGGGDKNITGGVLSAGTVSSDIGGNTIIIYCSTAVKRQTKDLPPVLLNWKE